MRHTFCFFFWQFRFPNRLKKISFEMATNNNHFDFWFIIIILKFSELRKYTTQTQHNKIQHNSADTFFPRYFELKSSFLNCFLFKLISDLIIE